MSLFFLAPFDPYAVGAYRVQDVFTEEFMRADYANFALFDGEHDDPVEHTLLLVAPSLSQVPATALMAAWKQVHELPAPTTWRLLVGPQDAWQRFDVPSPR